MGLGEFFALSSAFFWALAIVLFRRCGNTLPAFETNLYKIFIGFILLWPTIGLTEGWAMPAYTAAELGIVILSGYIGIAVADTWYLRALQLVGASRTGIVSSLLSPFIIILSVLFLSESLGPLQLLGFLLVMAGLLLVSWQANREEVDIRDLRKGMVFGVAAVFFMAVGVVMVKPILETHSFVWTVQLRMSAGMAGMLIFLAFRGRYRRAFESFRRPLPWGQLTVASFLGSYLSMMMWLYSYKLIPASVSSVLNQSTNAWMVLLAWLVLREYIGMRKIYGLILTTGGVLMMLLA
ncbi:MAG: DMT family transporter [Xanthomonadales bacterium]|jgi:drug/metabolite transporter (DMT)-like permease|nr:DMT family transporter [Xanthomonadales bacterium]